MYTHTLIQYLLNFYTRFLLLGSCSHWTCRSLRHVGQFFGEVTAWNPRVEFGRNRRDLQSSWNLCSASYRYADNIRARQVNAYCVTRCHAIVCLRSRIPHKGLGDIPLSRPSSAPLRSSRGWWPERFLHHLVSSSGMKVVLNYGISDPNDHYWYYFSDIFMKSLTKWFAF